MNYQLAENILTVNLEGRIDTSNADEIGAELLELAKKFTAGKFILNLENLSYISSAGLRAVLKLSKLKKKNLQLIEASREVFEVFETSGFTRMLDIQKSLRKISADNLLELGHGTSGTVYKLDEENILKVYKSNWTFEDVAKERANSQAAFLAGISTAISYDVVKVGENFGIVYEMINANTLEKVMLEDADNIAEHSRRFAEFVKEQHAVETDFDDVRQRLISNAENVEFYSAEDIKVVQKILDAVPNCQNFIHGDLNLGNVLLQDGQPVMIDMGAISSGHPIFDISWLYFMYVIRKKIVQAKGVKNPMGPKIMPDIMWKTFAKTYFNTNDNKTVEHYEQEILPYGLIKVLNDSITRPIPQKACEFYKNKLLNEVERGIITIDF